MQEAVDLIKRVFSQTRSLDAVIAELRRCGLDRNQTIYALMAAFDFDVVEADNLVLHSVIWSN